MMLKKLPIFILLFCLFGCAGYKLKTTNNPFGQYKINHLSVPMFVNQTSLVNVSSRFSQKFMLFLTEFSSLKVTAGESKNSDAVLLGIIKSPRNLQETTKVQSSLFTQGDLKTSIGNRNKLYVPKSTKVSLELRLILVKKNTGENEARSIIFDKTFPLSATFSRIISESTGPDSQGTVNFTKNRNNLYSTVDNLSDSAVQNFRDLIINVF